MAVFRIERTRDYTVMSNHHLRNANLSLKAKGLLSMMLSLPEDWNYTTRGLAKICKEGVDAIGAALRELEAAGYIVRHKLRDRQGRISDTEYVIYEQPQLRKPDTDSPDTENPYMDKPDTEKPAELNIEKSNTQKQNIYGSSTDSIPFRDCAADCLPERKGRDAMSLTEIESYRELMMSEGKTIGQLMEEMRAKAGAQNYHGHGYMDLQRFAEDTRHMIIFDVLTNDSPVGWKGERTRLFLSDTGYEKALDSQEKGQIKILSHAKVRQGNLHYDRSDQLR